MFTFDNKSREDSDRDGNGYFLMLDDDFDCDDKIVLRHANGAQLAIKWNVTRFISIFNLYFQLEKIRFS